MEPDLSNSITLHPTPFRSPSRPIGSARGSSQTSLHGGYNHGTREQNGSSTAVEPLNLDDAVARHHLSTGDDGEVESQMNGRLPRTIFESDPYELGKRYKSASEIEEIKANTSRKRDSGGGTDGTASPASNRSGGLGAGASVGARLTRGKLGAIVPQTGRTALQARRVTGFYQAQNDTIERLLKSVEEHRAEARQEQGDDHVKFKIGVWGSFMANVVLAILQMYAAISSGSLSLFTTMADSIFDPMSNITLILSNRAVRRVDPNRFPSGKARLETVGNIVFCFLMTAVSFILIAFSVREIVEHGKENDLNNFHLPSVIAVIVAFATKLSLFLYTWSIKDRYSQIRILWQDHRNDLFINGFGILTSVGGSKLIWWLDPAGAIVLSVLISVLWLRTAFTEFLLLVGVVASVEVQQLITYVCLTHSPSIRQIDTVRAYHSGPRLIAEVDIVMDPQATLKDTHDIAEELQIKLEGLPDVERAYVHVDYETTHKPEHTYKKDL